MSGKYESSLKTKVRTMTEGQLRKHYKTARGKNRDAIRTELSYRRAQQKARKEAREAGR